MHTQKCRKGILTSAAAVFDLESLEVSPKRSVTSSEQRNDNRLVLLQLDERHCLQMSNYALTVMEIVDERYK